MLKLIIIGGGVAVVTVAEKALIAAHVPEGNRVIVGLAFAAPFLVALLVLRLLANSKATAAPAPQRPRYPFGAQPGRKG